MSFRKNISVLLTIILAAVCFPVNTVAAAIVGDANNDGEVNIRDAAYIASNLSRGRSLSNEADFNGDGKVDIRDASAIVNSLITQSFEDYAVEMLEVVNAERAKVGASPLTLNVSLINAANIRAVEISKSFSHTRTNNTLFSTVLDELGIKYYCCGENIAAGVASAEKTAYQLVNSPAHYENIVNPSYTQLGIGYYYDANSTYKHHWVQIFKCD